MEAAQTLPLLMERPGTADMLHTMNVHRIRLAQDQGLRAWEPTLKVGMAAIVLAEVRAN